MTKLQMTNKFQVPKSKAKNRGFTLIEVLLAATIFLVVVTSAFYLIHRNLSLVKNSERLIQAILTAQCVAEELKKTSFADLVNSSFAAGEGSVIVQDIDADLKEIKIELKWYPQRPPLQLITLRAGY